MKDMASLSYILSNQNLAQPRPKSGKFKLLDSQPVIIDFTGPQPTQVLLNWADSQPKLSTTTNTHPNLAGECPNDQPQIVRLSYL